MVAETCDRVAVMYGGKIQEVAPVASCSTNPLHPYTQGLLGSIPRVDGAKARAPARHSRNGAEHSRPAGRLQVRDALSAPFRAVPRSSSRRSSRWRPDTGCAAICYPTLTCALRQDVILEVQDLTVRFPVFGGVCCGGSARCERWTACRSRCGRGETLGLVGESGCGKTTVGRAIVNILRAMSYGVEIVGHDSLSPRSRASVDLAPLSGAQMRPYRSDIQMVFQDPYSSLNPRKTVDQIVEEPLAIHTKHSRSSEQIDRVAWLLAKVGLSAEQANRYPHEFSGGQRQRIGIARALATNPKIVIADEPVSALDVSIQAQVINLMQDLQEEFGLSYMFIAHDLSVVRHISNRIAVMYLGNIVEMGDAETIYQSPLHPYSRALLASAPRPDPGCAPRPSGQTRRRHPVADQQALRLPVQDALPDRAADRAPTQFRHSNCATTDSSPAHILSSAVATPVWWCSRDHLASGREPWFAKPTTCPV